MGDAQNQRQALPLVVNLDGALLRSDLVFETAMAFVRRKPMRLFKVLGWRAQGRAVLASKLANETDIDVTVLPYDRGVINLIESVRSNGDRDVVLATGSHHTLGERVAEHLKLFDRVVPSEAAPRKQRLRREAEIIPLRPDLDTVPANDEVSPPRASTLAAWAEALRLHQWIKNVLIFVPLLSSHQLTNAALLTDAMLAFLFFGLCASSVYILNDLLDLEDDRHHLSKRNRPFASGRLSIKAGLIAFPLLLIWAFAGAILLLPWEFAGTMGAYYLLTLTYSLQLKRQMALDVIALAVLYTLRVVAGGVVLQLPLTFWLLAFSLFMFLSLALAKRYAELREAMQRGRLGKARGRDYDPNDLEMISSLGATSGYLSVLILALYVREPGTEVLYHRPEVIWLACPVLLFWITRVWMLTHRGQMHDDPVVFAFHDRVSLIAGVLFCAIFVAAL